jgi:hypothetical protein
MNRSLASVALLVTVVLVASACAGAGQSSEPSPTAAAPTVVIESGLSPRMTADQVEGIVLHQIHIMEFGVGRVVRPARIIAVTATTAAGVARLEPQSGFGLPPPVGIEWLVRAEGTFTNDRVPPGGHPMVDASGYFIVGDADGAILGFGMP